MRPDEDRIAAIRRFNRFYTRQIGVLEEGVLESPFTLTQLRVLYECAHRDAAPASEIARELALDAGYLSRVLRGFEKAGLVTRASSDKDARQSLVRLTKKGRDVFADLDRRSHDQVMQMIEPLAELDRARLLDAMGIIETMFAARIEPRVPYVIRPPRPGGFGWVIQRHGEFYGREYGWGAPIEAIVTRVVADYIERGDTSRERCWIAERDGINAGAIFLMRKTTTVAQLRLLFVEKDARGLGIGGRLVDECVRFAREARYRKIMLWTQDVLKAARHLYERAGFTLVKQYTHHDFGKPTTGEIWELTL